MAAHERVVVEGESEYECVTQIHILAWNYTADKLSSYESLPDNFSLAANMAAGAFAGIAVSSLQISFSLRVGVGSTNRWLGTLRYVPYRPTQGK